MSSWKSLFGGKCSYRGGSSGSIPGGTLYDDSNIGDVEDYRRFSTARKMRWFATSGELWYTVSTVSPHSSEDRAPASGAGCAGSSPAGGTNASRAAASCMVNPASGRFVLSRVSSQCVAPCPGGRPGGQAQGHAPNRMNEKMRPERQEPEIELNDSISGSCFGTLCELQKRLPNEHKDHHHREAGFQEA